MKKFVWLIIVALIIVFFVRYVLPGEQKEQEMNPDDFVEMIQSEIGAPFKYAFTAKHQDRLFLTDHRSFIVVSVDEDDSPSIVYRDDIMEDLEKELCVGCVSIDEVLHHQGLVLYRYSTSEPHSPTFYRQIDLGRDVIEDHEVDQTEWEQVAETAR